MRNGTGVYAGSVARYIWASLCTQVRAKYFDMLCTPMQTHSHHKPTDRRIHSIVPLGSWGGQFTSFFAKCHFLQKDTRCYSFNWKKILALKKESRRPLPVVFASSVSAVSQQLELNPDSEQHPGEVVQSDEIADVSVGSTGSKTC